MKFDCGPPAGYQGVPPGDLREKLLRVPLSVSILITSPVRIDLCYSPVGAFIVPLVESNVFFGAAIISFISLFISFLMKLHLVKPPSGPGPTGFGAITLSMSQLTSLMTAYIKGQPIDQYLANPQGTFGPVGGDEPLYPDNLSVALTLASPFADFDGSPDLNFNVPLFEVPGLQGSLVIALLILLSRFILESGGLALKDLGDPCQETDLIPYLKGLGSGGDGVGGYPGKTGFK